MAGRPPLDIGTHGAIKTKQLPSGVWQARCRYRDADGVTRPVERTGTTARKAEAALQKALKERSRVSGAVITGETKVGEAAERWLAQKQAEVDAGAMAPTSLDAYRKTWATIAEGLAELRLREMSAARCQLWQESATGRLGPGTIKTGRTILSGILGMAARMGAITTNPTRDLGKVSRKPKRRPRAMTRDERADWLDWMEKQGPLEAAVAEARLAHDRDALKVAERRLRLARKAVRWDLPDITRMMLATGSRIGEALAIGWDEVDLDAGTVVVAWKLIRVTGQGLLRVPGTKRGEDGGRVLRLPFWATTMLLRRRVETESRGPVFPDSLGRWRDPSNVMGVLREVRDEAGVEWLTSHVWRKTTATHMDEHGVAAREIADQLEHADISMTQRFYLGRRAVTSAEAAAALEDLL